MIIHEQAWQIVITALLSVFGELAHFLSKKSNKALEISNMISGCFVAAFSGTLAYFISKYIGLDLYLILAFAGLCGWIGPQVLDAFSSLVTKKVGLDIKKDRD